MTLNDQVSYILDGLEREHPKFAKGIRKWSTFLCHSVHKISEITGSDEADVLSDILLGLLKVNTMYDEVLYRYKGYLYIIVNFDGAAVCIETLKHNKKFHNRVWTHWKNIECVRKGKLESSIYREIYQQYIDIVSAHFTRKRGYEKELAGEKVVVIKSGPDKHVAKKMKVYKANRVVHLVNIDIPADREFTDHQAYPTGSDITEYLTDSRYNPEQAMISEEMVGTLQGHVSDDALIVFGCLLNDPYSRLNDVSRVTGMSRRKVELARGELLRGYSNLKNLSYYPKVEGTHPIYIQADQCN